MAAALENSYAKLIRERLEAAVLVVLGTLGAVHPLTPPNERPKGVPWAEAALEIERILKGPEKLREPVVVGPRYGSRHLPSAPPLHPGQHAIFFLSPAPPEAVELLGRGRRQSAFLVPTSMDIQPPERLPTIERILGGKRRNEAER